MTSHQNQCHEQCLRIGPSRKSRKSKIPTTVKELRQKNAKRKKEEALKRGKLDAQRIAEQTKEAIERARKRNARLRRGLKEEKRKKRDEVLANLKASEQQLEEARVAVHKWNMEEERLEEELKVLHEWVIQDLKEMKEHYREQDKGYND